jgi:hypothetical protein
MRFRHVQRDRPRFETVTIRLLNRCANSVATGM